MILHAAYKVMEIVVKDKQSLVTMLRFALFSVNKGKIG